MLLKQAGMVYWKKRAAAPECEVLRAVFWLESIHVMLRRKTSEMWAHQHRNVMIKLVVYEGWVQKLLYDIGWSDDLMSRLQ